MTAMNYNPSKSTWLNPNIEYLFNSEIIEYDMKDAGFSIIKYYRLLDQGEINMLDNMDKQERIIAIGKIRGKNKEFSASLSNKFAEMRDFFVSANSLSSDRIISVKNDAIFTMGPCKKLKFGKIEFAPKHQYTSYIRFKDNANIEIYYNRDNIDVKGIGDSSLNRHRLYLLHFLYKTIEYIESQNPYVKRFLKSFVDRYKNGELDEEYYIEFNNMSSTFNPLYNFQKVIIPIIHIIIKEL